MLGEQVSKLSSLGRFTEILSMSAKSLDVYVSPHL